MITLLISLNCERIYVGRIRFRFIGRVGRIRVYLDGRESIDRDRVGDESKTVINIIE